MTLPEDMRVVANLESGEEAWRPADFPTVIERASIHQLACIGGQFQFRGPIGTSEMYWLNADSEPQQQGESWSSYVTRANSEVLNTFTSIIEQTDFRAQARDWKHISDAMDNGIITDPIDHLYFVAYFSHKPPAPNQSLE